MAQFFEGSRCFCVTYYCLVDRTSSGSVGLLRTGVPLLEYELRTSCPPGTFYFGKAINRAKQERRRYMIWLIFAEDRSQDEVKDIFQDFETPGTVEAVQTKMEYETDAQFLCRTCVSARGMSCDFVVTMDEVEGRVADVDLQSLGRLLRLKTVAGVEAEDTFVGLVSLELEWERGICEASLRSNDVSSCVFRIEDWLNGGCNAKGMNNDAGFISSERNMALLVLNFQDDVCLTFHEGVILDSLFSLRVI